MIDVESEIYDIVAGIVKAKYPNVIMENRRCYDPAKFPCIYLKLADAPALQKTRDTGSNERHINMMWEVNIYSNKQGASAREAKDLFYAVDEAMQRIGFTRTMYEALNWENQTVYRILGRWQAICSEDGKIYKR